ncbi:hypothetical protein I302_102907 [Kwoniella bestiolae CBS 10118]|uniref:Uncharacterized protein n=1 Tax=Kwoniella bestiolae CBS 10118 TaxID=1296100 RepID=A0A1B9GGA2_9TREE|nr:hypothetical protein I302_01603 [Kwoniella bestiolae CBS 10118]OCF30084.1 hypothetical protein I302_01603 [Kwoniella bestiolae CBS 10118]
MGYPLLQQFEDWIRCEQIDPISVSLDPRRHGAATLPDSARSRLPSSVALPRINIPPWDGAHESAFGSESVPYPQPTSDLSDQGFGYHFSGLGGEGVVPSQSSLDLLHAEQITGVRSASSLSTDTSGVTQSGGLSETAASSLPESLVNERSGTINQSPSRPRGIGSAKVIRSSRRHGSSASQRSSNSASISNIQEENRRQLEQLEAQAHLSQADDEAIARLKHRLSSSRSKHYTTKRRHELEDKVSRQSESALKDAKRISALESDNEALKERGTLLRSSVGIYDNSSVPILLDDHSMSLETGYRIGGFSNPLAAPNLDGLQISDYDSTQPSETWESCVESSGFTGTGMGDGSETPSTVSNSRLQEQLQTSPSIGNTRNLSKAAISSTGEPAKTRRTGQDNK